MLKCFINVEFRLGYMKPHSTKMQWSVVQRCRIRRNARFIYFDGIVILLTKNTNSPLT